MAKKILIVEDEAVNSIVLEKTLKDLGYEVAGNAFNAQEAISMARDEKPDLILMDIRIQGEVDGIEAAKEIYALYNIPIIYLTAHSDDDTIKRAVESGPFGYLIKPFKEKELYSNIEMTIHKHKLFNASRPQTQKELDQFTIQDSKERSDNKETEYPTTRETLQLEMIPKKTDGIQSDNTFAHLTVSSLRYPVFLFDRKGLLLYMNKAFKTYLYRMGVTVTQNKNLSVRNLPEFISSMWVHSEEQLRNGKHITASGNTIINGKKEEFRLEMYPLFKNNALSYITCILLPSVTGQKEEENKGLKGFSHYLFSDIQTRLREIHFLASPEDCYRFRQISVYSGEALKLLSDIEDQFVQQP